MAKWTVFIRWYRGRQWTQKMREQMVKLLETELDSLNTANGDDTVTVEFQVIAEDLLSAQVAGTAAALNAHKKVIGAPGAMIEMHVYLQELL